MANWSGVMMKLIMEAWTPLRGLITGMWISVFILMPTIGVGLGLPGLSLIAAIALVLVSFCVVYTKFRPDERIARLFSGICELLLASIAAGALSYAATSLGLPLWDATFDSWDKAIGFDWHYWLNLLNDHPDINAILGAAYRSMIPQLLLIIMFLAGFGELKALDRFLLAYTIAACVTAIFCAVMPALSPIVHYGITIADHPNITLAVPREFQEHTLALRSGEMNVLELSGAQGVVTFPSFHTICAVLLSLAFWHAPYVRWLGLALNFLMLVSIPIQGSHYIVDVFAGIAVALLCWMFAGQILREGTGIKWAGRGAMGMKRPGLTAVSN